MIDRRAMMSGALAAATPVWGDPPTPAKGDPKAPEWPAKERFPLWPGSPPGAPATPPTPEWTMNGPADQRELWITGVAAPEVHVFRPAKPDGTALLSFPGGGYRFLSVQNEGINVAKRFTPTGTTVFVLTYRLPGEGWSDRHLVALQDAQRAVRLIRARAGDLGILPDKLGVIGFSAGGHLAADLATAFAEPVYAAVDEADQVSARPAFAGLIYPVTTLRPVGGGSTGSASMLLGNNLSATLANERSPALKVTEQTPPVFIAHSFDDPVVSGEHGLMMIAACRRAKVSVEAHLFAAGGHGYGLKLPPTEPAGRWPDLFEAWMRKI